MFIRAFIVGCIAFFAYIEARILFSSKTTLFEKVYGTLAIATLEFYYFMQLLEHL